MRCATKTRFARATGLALIVLACEDVTTPGGGGIFQEDRSCRNGRTSGWANNQLSLTVTDPTCPFTVDNRNSLVPYAAIVTVPSSKIENDAFGDPISYVNAQALSWYNGSVVAHADFVHFQQDPSNASIWRAEPHASGFPGLMPKSQDSLDVIFDSLDVEGVFLASGANAHGWKMLPGHVSGTFQILVGPAGFTWGTAPTWRSMPTWDTTAYTYRWLLNGEKIPNALHATYSGTLGPAGTYNLSNITISADNSQDTVAIVVTVGISVGVSGPATVVENTSGHWDASPAGGTPPYQYQWYADNTPVGENSPSLNLALGPGGTNHRLDLMVTDSHGASGAGVYDVYADYANCPGCDPFTRVVPVPQTPLRNQHH